MHNRGDHHIRRPYVDGAVPARSMRNADRGSIDGSGAERGDGLENQRGEEGGRREATGRGRSLYCLGTDVGMDGWVDVTRRRRGFCGCLILECPLPPDLYARARRSSAATILATSTRGNHGRMVGRRSVRKGRSSSSTRQGGDPIQVEGGLDGRGYHYQSVPA